MNIVRSIQIDRVTVYMAVTNVEIMMSILYRQVDNYIQM